MRLPDPERSRVVLMGTSEYHDEAIPDLPAAEASLRDLYILLSDPTFGIVPEQNCISLLNEGDIRLLGRRLRSAILEAEDLLLVYFAGHGLIGGKRHELYLGLPDSEWNHPEFSSLEFEKLRSAVLNSRATTKVIILDCCFSGRVVSDTMADPIASVVGQLEVDGTYVLTSAQRDQVALVLPGEEHTAFTGRLMKLLQEGIPEGPQLLSIEDIYRHLLAVMQAQGLPQPQKRGTRTADLIALARNRAVVSRTASALESRYLIAVESSQRGDWLRVNSLLEDVCVAQADLLGENHPDFLRSSQLLAHSIGALGDPREAAVELHNLLARQVGILGDEHVDVLQTRQYLALNMGEAGYRTDAIKILRILLPMRRRVLGAHAPATLRTCHLLARNLMAIGEVDEAEALLREVVEWREHTLGAHHPHTERAKRDLSQL